MMNVNKDNYIEYKTKYFELIDNINLIGGTIIDSNSDSESNISDDSDSDNIKKFNYQEIIYEIAKYLKPHLLNKFRQEYGVKQLSNQVIELNKASFLSELQNEITKYYMTDKIDGKRTILYLTDTKSYAVNDVLSDINIRTKDICILDTEKYNNIYYIFDVMVYEGNSLMNLTFEDRMNYFDKFNNIPDIKTKPFIKLTSEYRQQIRTFKNEKKPYEVDGLILTPSYGLYNTMKVYKYKSLEHLTIDFLIKKCPNKLLDLYTNHSDYFDSALSNSTNTGGNLYLLFCGISKRVFYKLRMNLIKFYEDIFSEINIKNLPNYFPIQFEPSDKKYAYFYWNNDSNLDGEVGEFFYNVNSKQLELKRIRDDRKIEVKRGNYFGNNYKIAEFIWMAFKDPLIIEDLNDEPLMYFQESDNILQKASRNFNSYVKSELFKKFKGTDWVIDLASGKGQDLFRYSTNGMKNVLFLEIDKIALTELISRKHIFSNDDKYPNKMNILIENVDLMKPYKKNIKIIDNVYTLQNIDLIMCNFAFHYFVENKKSIQNICKLINHYLKPNGKFVFTAFDGKKIINLLTKNNGQWMIKMNNQIKYSIKKKYEQNEIKSYGQKIEVLLPFSKNTYYEEYLINIDTISRKLKKYNITLETNESFSKYLNSYRGYMDYNDKTYVDLYHYYIFTKHDVQHLQDI